MAFKTAADLLKGALRKAGEVTNGNSRLHADALNLLNQAYIDVLSGSSRFDLEFGQPWSWAIEEVPLSIVLKTPFQSGEVVLTQNSTAGSFSSPPSESMAGRHLKVTGRSEYYVIDSHTAGSASFTLQVAFIGTSGNYEFSARKLVYDLGDEVLRLAGPIENSNSVGVDGGYKIYHTDIRNFKEDYPVSRVESGMPTKFTKISEKDDSYKIQFNKYLTSEDALVTVPYIKKPEALLDNAGSVPIVPIQHRTVLEYMAASDILFNLKKDPGQGSIMLNLAKQGLRAMIEDENRQNRVSGNNRGRLIPRRGETGPFRWPVE